jgi:acetamidase/formamidase
VGDVHFAQGDGEVCGTGIEIEAAVTVRLGLRKAPRWVPRFPAYVTPPQPARARFATTGIPADAAMDLTAAARAALLAMIDWLEAEHGVSRPAAYCLCSACVDLHLSQVVDIPYPLVSALIPLDVFEAP